MWNWEACPFTQALAANKSGFSDLSYQGKESQTTPSTEISRVLHFQQSLS